MSNDYKTLKKAQEMLAYCYHDGNEVYSTCKEDWPTYHDFKRAVAKCGFKFKLPREVIIFDGGLVQEYFNELIYQEQKRQNMIEMVEKNKWPKNLGSAVNYCLPEKFNKKLLEK